MAGETLFSKPGLWKMHEKCGKQLKKVNKITKNYSGIFKKVIDIFHETAYNNKTDSSFVPSCL